MADAFSGSIISLISKSDIRYEGVMSGINTRIGLKNVKSFGTEGRRADGPQVPPTDNIYKYMLFRGSDIKDLRVKASPPIQTVPLTFDDPAIIELHSPPSTLPCKGSPITGSVISQTGPPNLCQPAGDPRMPMYSPGLHGVPNDLQAQLQWMQNPKMNTHSSSVHGKSAALSSIPVKNIAHNSQSPMSVNTAPNGETEPPSVTPSDFLPSGSGKDKAAPPQPLQNVRKDVEVVQVAPSNPLIPKSLPPLLPLPSPSAEKNSRPATRFTKEFDFEAMNEKFNKDEIWGHLGKSNEAQGGEKFSQDGMDAGPSESETMTVYAKDEFYDSLSCNSLTRDSHNGRIKYSERMKLDAETFGDMARHGDGRGVLGPGRGGNTRGGYMRGSYHTRGHGYTGRGRGRHS